MRSAILIGWRPCAAALLLAAAAPAPRASAVVISAASDAANLVAPGNDPGWINVGRVGNASGVYLGNRWVVTANHVGDAALRLSDGRELVLSIGSGVRLSNTGGFGSPDVRMFRLAADPGLAALEIGTAPPGVGSLVTMIGAGLDRAPELIGWQTTAPQWTEVPLPLAGVLGFSLSSTSQLRWGVNQVASESTFSLTDQTFSFSTRFDRPGVPFEAQAATGDSGGGVFFDLDGAWKLVGVMTSTQLLGNQPGGTVAFGDQTIVADLTAYRSQILELVNRAEPLWQNQENHYDVSGSGRVTPRDALLLINELLGAGPHALEGAPGWFLDVNGDYRISPSDVNQVVNALLGAANAAAAPTAGVNFVPEPSGAALAAFGVLWAVVAGSVARRWPLLRSGAGGDRRCRVRR